MKGLRGLAASVVLTACATGGNPATPERDAAVTPPPPDAADPGIHDAGPIDPPPPDAFVPPPPDAFVPPPPDAFVPPPPDACVPTNTQLLANPVFDLTPVGTGWQQTLIDPGAPLVTDQDGVPEHTAPFKAWLGGIVAPDTTVTDVLLQDVVVPPLTSQLVLSGVFDVRTAETATSAFDTATLAVTRTDGTPVQSVLSLSNLTPKTGWTSFEVTLPPGLSGQTIRIQMTSSNDFLDPTSFYFDSLAVVATHGCP